MSRVNWKEMMGWEEEQLQELRFSGFGFLREGKYETARLFFEGLVVLNPENAYDLQTLGALYLQIGKNGKALKYLDRALAIDPAHEPTMLNKVKALMMLGKKVEALPLAQRLQKSSFKQIADDASALIIANS
ncbi:MAG: tetratricopeptide repeat protein [Chlamydiales bacterium]